MFDANESSVAQAARRGAERSGAERSGAERSGAEALACLTRVRLICPSSSAAPGRVSYRQSPRPGPAWKRGARKHLWVSRAAQGLSWLEGFPRVAFLRQINPTPILAAGDATNITVPLKVILTTEHPPRRPNVKSTSRPTRYLIPVVARYLGLPDETFVLAKCTLSPIGSDLIFLDIEFSRQVALLEMYHDQQAKTDRHRGNRGRGFCFAGVRAARVRQRRLRLRHGAGVRRWRLFDSRSHWRR